jgi:hypothetical protein
MLRLRSLLIAATKDGKPHAANTASRSLAHGTKALFPR